MWPAQCLAHKVATCCCYYYCCYSCPTNCIVIWKGLGVFVVPEIIILIKWLLNHLVHAFKIKCLQGLLRIPLPYNKFGSRERITHPFFSLLISLSLLHFFWTKKFLLCLPCFHPPHIHPHHSSRDNIALMVITSSGMFWWFLSLILFCLLFSCSGFFLPLC